MSAVGAKAGKPVRLTQLLWSKSMPIYEYRCQACGESFEVFVRSPSRQADPTCPKCGSQKVKKAISLFGVSGATRSTASGASCSTGST
jgi:putative FmdB family regulatory protein